MDSETKKESGPFRSRFDDEQRLLRMLPSSAYDA